MAVSATTARTPRTPPRLSARVLRPLNAATRLRPVQRAAAHYLRDYLSINAALALDAGMRSPMPLYYGPLRARSARPVSGMMTTPQVPSAVPSAQRWCELYRSGTANPVEVLGATLQQIKRLDRATPTMSCFNYLDEEGSMRDAKASAERWHKGQPLGPLDGVVVPVKEMADIEGSAYRLGTAFLRPRDARDATAVARLRAAGAIIVGQTTMTEMGMSPLGANIHRRMPRNAHAVDRMAGGSSTGSAVAIATGLAPVTLGCDGGGSLRIPASFNGIFSIKPTAGRVSRKGDGYGGSLCLRHRLYHNLPRNLC